MPVPLRSNTSVTGCGWSRSVSKRYSRLLAQPRAPRACRIAGMSQFALTSSHKLASTLSTHGRPLPPRAMDDEPPKRTSATRPRERLRAGWNVRINGAGAGARNEHRRSRWDAWQLAWARCRAFRCDYVFFCLPPSFLRSGGPAVTRIRESNHHRAGGWGAPGRWGPRPPYLCALWLCESISVAPNLTVFTIHADRRILNTVICVRP